MKKLNMAIVGCGRIAQRHAEHISRLAFLSAVCDVNAERKEQFASKYNCRSYAGIGELLLAEEDLDLVSVCSPNGMHARHSILALKAGINVLCEKPMAISTEDCKKMIAASKESGKHLMVIKQNRFNAPVAELKKVVDEGRLGKIINVQLNCFWNRNNQYYDSSEWKGKKEMDGGTLFTQFSHFIDLLYWLVGEVSETDAFTGNFLHSKNVEFEDTGVVCLKFDNGALGTINYTVNSFEKNMEGSITVFGEKGTVKIGGQYLNVLEYQKIQGYEMTCASEIRPANDYGFYQGSMSNHDKVYENVIEVLTRNAAPATSALEGLKTVEIIEKIYLNSKKTSGNNGYI
jgi:UDP-N-acetyl-2-amino-2-deoxyglucuronate dehydrogenase